MKKPTLNQTYVPLIETRSKIIYTSYISEKENCFLTNMNIVLSVRSLTCCQLPV